MLEESICPCLERSLRIPVNKFVRCFDPKHAQTTQFFLKESQSIVSINLFKIQLRTEDNSAWYVTVKLT